MSRVPTGSRKVEQEQRAQANKSDIPNTGHDKATGVESGGDTSKISQQSADKVHCFCPILAEEHGEHAAVILQGLGYKIGKSQHVLNGRRWFYDTLGSLEKRWPYLHASGIHGIIEPQVQKGNIFKNGFNKKSYDRTTWYSMPDELVKRALSDDGKFWFNVDVAVKSHSIVAGTIYENLRYHLLLFLAENPNFKGVPYYRVNKAALARLFPWSSLRTIKRAFTTMISEKCIALNPASASEYTICSLDDLIVPEGMRKESKIGSSTEMGSGSSTEKTVPSTEQSVPSAEETVPSTENNTHYKPFGKHIHKHHSPSAQPEVSGVRADAAGAVNGSGHQDINQVSATVPGKENETVHDDFMPTSLKELRSKVAAYVDKLSEAEQETAKRTAPGFAFEFVTGESIADSLEICYDTNSAKAIIHALGCALYKAIKEYTSKEHWSPDAIKLSFLLNLEILIGSCLIQTCTEEPVRKPFEAVWDNVLWLHDHLPELFGRQDASAESKTGMLMDEINTCNKNGWPTYDDGEVCFRVDGSEKTKKAAIAFFNANPEVSAEEAWQRLSDCVEVAALSNQRQGYDALWYARRGVKPYFLFKHWETICADLLVTPSFKNY